MPVHHKMTFEVSVATDEDAKVLREIHPNTFTSAVFAVLRRQKRLSGTGFAVSSPTITIEGDEQSLWLALHHHRHGVDTFFVRSKPEPTQEQFIAACEIDFEPDREEYIDIFHVNPGWVKELSRPSDCECDNTHEQNNTCCMPCWNAGFRTVARSS